MDPLRYFAIHMSITVKKFLLSNKIFILSTLFIEQIISIHGSFINKYTPQWIRANAY